MYTPSHIHSYILNTHKSSTEGQTDALMHAYADTYTIIYTLYSCSIYDHKEQTLKIFHLVLHLRGGKISVTGHGFAFLFFLSLPKYMK